MNKEELKNMANNPDLIPGIYNYCDRWCERCSYTSRCLVFATEKKAFPDDSHDMEQQEFWMEMKDVFKVTFELLEEAAEDLGINLDENEDENVANWEATKREQAEKHPAAKNAMEYISAVNRWFNESDAIFRDKGLELENLAALDLPDNQLTKEAEQLQDFVEIIRWYQHQIYAKIMRALQGKMDEIILDEATVQNDHNGSAKVALMGIDRSIAAWGGLMKIFPEEEDSILRLLVELEKTRKQVENELPDARRFKRPGFDE